MMYNCLEPESSMRTTCLLAGAASTLLNRTNILNNGASENPLPRSYVYGFDEDDKRVNLMNHEQSHLESKVSASNGADQSEYENLGPDEDMIDLRSGSAISEWTSGLG